MKLIKFVDGAAFFVTVVAGSVAAMAGGYNWPRTAFIAGCVSVIAPIVNRITAAREQKMRGPRTLSDNQRARLLKALQLGPLPKVWICHNRHEGEPSQFHAQLFEVFKEAGNEPQWFGGMSNTTIGIEIGGQPSPQKSLLMKAFRAAKIPFVEVEFKDDSGQRWGLSVWIGSNPF